MVQLSAPPRTVLAALPRRQDRFRLRDRTDGVVAVRHLMHPHGRARKLAELFEAFDCATLTSLGRPGPMLAASPRAAESPSHQPPRILTFEGRCRPNSPEESCPAELQDRLRFCRRI